MGYSCNSYYAIFHEPIKCYLLLQDVILHRTTGANDNARPMQTPDHVNRIGRWGLSVPIATPRDTNKNVNTRQDNRIWISSLDNYRDRVQARF